VITNRTALFALVCLAVVGCGGGGISPPRTVPASGTVLLKGKPAAGVTVKFLPQFDIGTPKWEPSAVTDKDGKFTLSTGAVGNGAPPGEYKVTFELLKAGADKRGLDTEIDAWKGKYANPDTALKVTVSGSGGELEPFRLD
jgi:hypothetical protein